ncbi:MAG: peptidoglycan bridge formation glycyltransferase FemA/FemB family protein [Spirochaetes bacterium]|nr:peptidoglycan bridge formation glycyltransferase FemA/FemB family protein [Spirochaetota bacterium]
MQSAFWARFKQQFGWSPHLFAVGDLHSGAASASGSRPDMPLLVLTRRLSPGMHIAYIPHGPEAPELVAAGAAGAAGAAVGVLAELAAEVAERLERRPLFVRFDVSFEEAATGGLVRAPVDIQPPSTVIIDLTPEEEALLGAMKPKTRYNVRLAGKRGVDVRAGRVRAPADKPADDLDRWYELYRETAERDRIAIHSPAYYRALFDTAGAYPGVDLSLLVAEHEGELLAGIIVLRFGGTATYLYGASSNHKRNLMAPYALQWEAMRRSREAGAAHYDLFGVPPADDPGHPMHGLYRFKTGFGGRILHRAGGWDYPARPAGYALYRTAERARTFYYKRVKKR